MLTMVMANPMHTTIVIAEPLTSAGAFLATRAENWGESAAIVIPQKIMKTRNATNGNGYTKGESRQHTPEQNNATVAKAELPNRIDNTPPT